MVHGDEAALPSEVLYNAPRVMAYEESASSPALEDDVDILDESQDIALTCTVVYQQGLRNYHSRRLSLRSFSKGDLVLRLKKEGHLKFESPWEGPSVIS
jgi:hypothetical protein